MMGVPLRSRLKALWNPPTFMFWELEDGYFATIEWPPDQKTLDQIEQSVRDYRHALYMEEDNNGT